MTGHCHILNFVLYSNKYCILRQLVSPAFCQTELLSWAVDKVSIDVFEKIACYSVCCVVSWHFSILSFPFHLLFSVTEPTAPMGLKVGWELQMVWLGGNGICSYLPDWKVTLLMEVMVKQSLFRPRGFWEVEATSFQDSLNMKVVSTMHRLLLPPRKYSWYLFLLEAELTPGTKHSWKDCVEKC
jgi:hypothetical protein